MSRTLQAFWFQFRWPTMAIRLGWDMSFGDGNRRIPRLLGARWLDDRQFQLACRPTAKHPQNKWQDMAEQLRRDMGAFSSSWQEDKPGVLLITLDMQPIPLEVPFQWSPELAQDHLIIGRGAGDREVAWRPFEIPHMLIAGSTQGGKGGAMRVIAVGALATGWRLFGINPRMSGEFGWLARYGCPVVSDLEQVCELVVWLFEEVQRRQRVVNAAGVGSWQALRGSGQLPANWSPLMVIVDEAASLLTPNKANKDMAATQLQIGDLLARIAMVGRAVGVHLVVATQRPDASMLGPAGGQLRNNLDARIVVGSLDADGLRMMLGSADEASSLAGIKGRALVAKLHGGDGSPRAVQVYRLDEDGEEVARVRPLVTQGRVGIVAGQV